MSAAEGSDNEGLLTIDELASAVGMTVRTTRYYATLGLIPQPIRRGRIAYYDEGHKARLEMVRALQDHGFTLQAIEGYMGGLPAEITVDELVLRRAMLIPWAPQAREELSKAKLEALAGRKLTASDLETLVAMRAIEASGRSWVPQPAFRIGIDLLGLDIPLDSIVSAGEAIHEHISVLARELTAIMKTQVLEPFRSGQHTPEEARAFEETVARLRQLTVEAVVVEFQRTANDLITGSLVRPAAGDA
ncbi:MerR family transcriptional regulator [Nocardioides sp. AE5]|uniref:MerR family transcriptional regulator n=1 Tax=Nocardioides sp. AE5 TaxID=2962573 RepID=UPI002880DEBC|nr:MerR family transcriptional regulator [Nocardioides sp. AE5]MDT0202014.1 MerR family transcriptional regulator [Nocardioides sp. AE5]